MEIFDFFSPPRVAPFRPGAALLYYMTDRLEKVYAAPAEIEEKRRGGFNLNPSLRDMFFCYEPEMIFSLSNSFASANESAPAAAKFVSDAANTCHVFAAEEKISLIAFTELSIGTKYAHEPILSPRNILPIAATRMIIIKGPTYELASFTLFATVDKSDIRATITSVVETTTSSSRR